jgi:hypothetical protein
LYTFAASNGGYQPIETFNYLCRDCHGILSNSIHAAKACCACRCSAMALTS